MASKIDPDELRQISIEKTRIQADNELLKSRVERAEMENARLK